MEDVVEEGNEVPVDILMTCEDAYKAMDRLAQFTIEHCYNENCLTFADKVNLIFETYDGADYEWSQEKTFLINLCRNRIEYVFLFDNPTRTSRRNAIKNLISHILKQKLDPNPNTHCTYYKALGYLLITVFLILLAVFLIFYMLKQQLWNSSLINNYKLVSSYIVLFVLFSTMFIIYKK